MTAALAGMLAPINHAGHRTPVTADCIGPYRILEKLGSGGMGDVYLAEDGRLRRLVALKAVAAAHTGPAARRRLLKEARAAATLNHPNIAAVYDVVESDGQAHIVMEYVRGETLSTRVRRGPLAPGAVLDIAMQLTGALAAAHAAGVVHRDLKCDNVIVDPEGRAKVLDFSLATFEGADSGTHGPGPDHVPSNVRRLRGTPPYMSPEQLLGRAVDHRSDIYSLGVVLYELLTGRRPFQGEDVAVAVLSGKCASARELNPRVPADLDQVVSKAMHRDLARRYQSAEQMRAELARASALMAAGPTLSREWPRRALRGTARRTGAVLALAALGGGLGSLVCQRAIRPGSALPIERAAPPVVAVLPLSNLSGDSSKDHLGVGMAHLLVSSLARLPGITVVPVSERPHRGRSIRKIAADLGADLIVDGGVQRAGHSVVVTVALVEGATERVLWADTYEAPGSGLSALPRQAADGLAGALGLTLDPADRARLQHEPTSDPDALAEYTQARAFLERRDVPGNLQRAVDLFQSAVRRDPRFAVAQAGLGEAYWGLYELTRERDWTIKARDATAEALRLEPDQPAARYTLAVIYRGRGLTRVAVEEARRAIELQPRSDDAHRLLGRLLADQGETEQALAEVRQAITLRPNYWEGHSALGHVYLEAGRFAEAVTAFQRVTELQPDSGWGYQMLGTAYQLAGDLSRARQSYERALDLRPDARSYASIGTLHHAEGRLDEAVRAYEQAARLEPSAPGHHAKLGDAYRRLGRPAQARQHYERAIELIEPSLQVNPTDTGLLALLAVNEAKVGRRTEALARAEQAVALSPRSAAAHYRRAAVCALLGDLDTAAGALQQALRLGYSPADAQADEDLAALRAAGAPHRQRTAAPATRSGTS